MPLKPGEIKSDLQVFRLENRYVGNLASYRGPVGVEIAVQGRGLTKYDSITFGDKKAQTRYLSENELRFTIPAYPLGSITRYNLSAVHTEHSILVTSGSTRVHLAWFPHLLKSRRETQPPFFSKLIMMHQVAV